MTGRRRDQTRDVTGGRPVVAVLATLVPFSRGEGIRGPISLQWSCAAGCVTRSTRPRNAATEALPRKGGSTWFCNFGGSAV